MSDFTFLYPSGGGGGSGGSGSSSSSEGIPLTDSGYLYSGQTLSAIDQAKASLLVDTSEGEFLTTIGLGYGVPRPPNDPSNDELYRLCIQCLAWLPKTIQHTAYALAGIIFGTQEEIEDAGGRAWQIYEVNPNEFIFECPTELIAYTNVNASYMHGHSGIATRVSNSQFSSVGENAANAATTLIGLNVYVFHTGVWNTYSITGHSYNSGTKTNTFTVNPTTIPNPMNGVPYYVDIPDTSSHRGDFMAVDATEEAGQTVPAVTAPVDDRLYIAGLASLDTFNFYMDLLRAAGVVMRVELI